jgi:hypothetical protein
MLMKTNFSINRQNWLAMLMTTFFLPQQVTFPFISIFLNYENSYKV